MPCLYFNLSYGLVKIRHNSKKYSAILHTQTSNKIYLFTKKKSITSVTTVGNVSCVIIL